MKRDELITRLREQQELLVKISEDLIEFLEKEAQEVGMDSSDVQAIIRDLLI